MFAVPIYKAAAKTLAAKGKGTVSRGAKILSHYEYNGKNFLPKDLIRTKKSYRSESGRMIYKSGYVPKEDAVPFKVSSESAAYKPRKRPKTIPSKIEKFKVLDAMSDQKLNNLTNIQAVEMLGPNGDMMLSAYRQRRLGPGIRGTRTKFTDKEGNPIYMAKYGDAVQKLSAKNTQIAQDVFKKINTQKEFGGVNAAGNLIRHLGRMLAQGEARTKKGLKGFSQDELMKKFSELDAPFFNNLLGTRQKLNKRQIAKAKELGLIDDTELLEVSHIVRAADDPTKSFDKDNLFLSMMKQNRDKARIQKPIENFIENYEDMLDKRILKYYGYEKAGGGLIKALGKALTGGKTDQSRRKFLKQAMATSAMAAMPGGAVRAAAALAPAVVKGATRKSPPWIKAMVSALESNMGKNLKLLDTKVTDMKAVKTYRIKTADGDSDLVHYSKYKNGDVHVEFDIRDDFANNQHIYADNKTGITEIVDENYYMTGPEDFAKDDPIIFDVTTPTQMAEMEKKMGVMRGDVDGRMLDYASIPEADYDYGLLMERYADTFSPYGNIFNTKKRADVYRENQRIKNMTEEEFESQFRGGNIHGYYRGGTSMRSYPRTAIKDMDKLVDAVGMAETNPAYMEKYNLGARNTYISPTGNVGTYGIGRATALDPGYYQHGATRFEDFDQNKFDEAKQREFSKNYLTGMIGYYTANPDKMIYGNDPVYESIIRYGPTDTRETGDYYKKVLSFYNQGGIARRPDAVPPLKGPASKNNFAAGGIVKKLLAPKPVVKRSAYKPQIAAKPFQVVDGDGLPVKDFKTMKEAEDFAGDGLYVGRRADAPDKGAMYFLSREKIINAPSESLKGAQWLQYLKRPFANYNPVKDMELNDTGLAPFLSRNANETLSKEGLVKAFDDELAPDFDVISLGGGARRQFDELNKINKQDLQAFRPGPVKTVLESVRKTTPALREALENNNQEAVLGIVQGIEKITEGVTGVPNAITRGFPQKFPFELKRVLQELAQISGARLAGFKKYQKEASYYGQQTLGGGANYREFLFKYSPKGKRTTEPVYTYAHDFGLTSSQRSNAFVHMRTSDRTDEFGRRLLHIEEIQSDMHQPINRAAREVKASLANNVNPGAEALRRAKYAPRGDLIADATNKSNQQQLKLIMSKIEDIQSGPMTREKQIRLTRLNRERAKIRKMIEDEQAKLAQGNHSGVPQGPYSKTEDYNEFVMKYALKVAEEGGYDGISISSAGIKNRNLTQGSRDYQGNVAAYGPIAEGAMKKAAKKSGAKYMKTAIIDHKGRGWEIPMIYLDDASKANVSKGIPAYSRGGIVANG